jgi:2-polyprenyl-6-methoxyphenol hydroxylase-like FAD-dependent oxidoreductase
MIHMKNMKNSLDVLVVGAGPTGLTMAGELARRGLNVRIIDKAAEPPADHSRALAIQARTIEIFEQMGIADDEKARGMRVEALNILLPSGRRGRLPLPGMMLENEPFPGMLVVQQFDTEAVLASRLGPLGVTPERGVALVSYTQDKTGVTATLRLRDGATEEVRASWLLGCDGAHSAVRKGAGIVFEGDTYDDQCLLGDVVIDWPLPDGEIYISPARDGLLAAFPVPGKHRFRVILILPENRRDTAAELSLEEFEGTARSLSPIDFRIQKAIVLSRYRLHHRVATRLREGRAFLSGDAAHIHSPAGGQGMNTGIQDAFNLAWKIAAVEQGRMPAWVLDTYEMERLPVARRLVNFTDRLFGALAGHGAAGRLLRAAAPRLMSRLIGFPPLQRRIAGFVSQLRIRYRNSPLSVQLGGAPRRGPRPGERAPTGALLDASGGQVRIIDLLREPSAALLLFTGQGASSAAASQARSFADRIKSADLRTFVINIGPGVASGGPGELADPEGRVHATYGVEGSAAVLLRPDGHIGVRCDPLLEGELTREIGRWFTRGA